MNTHAMNPQHNATLAQQTQWATAALRGLQSMLTYIEGSYDQFLPVAHTDPRFRDDRLFARAFSAVSTWREGSPLIAQALVAELAASLLEDLNPHDDRLEPLRGAARCLRGIHTQEQQKAIRNQPEEQQQQDAATEREPCSR